MEILSYRSSQNNPRLEKNLQKVSSTAYKPANKHKPTKSTWIEPAIYKDANAEKSRWLLAVKAEIQLTANEQIILDKLVFHTNATGFGDPSIATLVEDAACCKYNTTQKALKKFEANGLIRIDRRGYKKSNGYQLIGLNTKLESCSPNSNVKYTSLTPRDLNNIHTYNEYECFLSNSEIRNPKAKPKPKPKEAKQCDNRVRHINDSEVTNENIEQTVTTLCEQHNIDNEQRKLILTQTQLPSVQNRAGYLAQMLRQAKEGALQNVNQKPMEYEKNWEAQKKRERECGTVDNAIGSLATALHEQFSIADPLNTTHRAAAHQNTPIGAMHMQQKSISTLEKEQEIQSKAAKMASERLKAEGILMPVWDLNLSPEQNMDNLSAWRAIEQEYYEQELRLAKLQFSKPNNKELG